MSTFLILIFHPKNRYWSEQKLQRVRSMRAIQFQTQKEVVPLRNIDRSEYTKIEDPNVATKHPSCLFKGTECLIN